MKFNDLELDAGLALLFVCAGLLGVGGYLALRGGFYLQGVIALAGCAVTTVSIIVLMQLDEGLKRL